MTIAESARGSRLCVALLRLVASPPLCSAGAQHPGGAAARSLGPAAVSLEAGGGDLTIRVVVWPGSCPIEPWRDQRATGSFDTRRSGQTHPYRGLPTCLSRSSTLVRGGITPAACERPSASSPLSQPRRSLRFSTKLEYPDPPRREYRVSDLEAPRGG